MDKVPALPGNCFDRCDAYIQTDWPRADLSTAGQRDTQLGRHPDTMVATGAHSVLVVNACLRAPAAVARPRSAALTATAEGQVERVVGGSG